MSVRFGPRSAWDGAFRTRCCGISSSSPASAGEPIVNAPAGIRTNVIVTSSPRSTVVVGGSAPLTRTELTTKNTKSTKNHCPRQEGLVFAFPAFFVVRLIAH